MRCNVASDSDGFITVQANKNGTVGDLTFTDCKAITFCGTNYQYYIAINPFLNASFVWRAKLVDQNGALIKNSITVKLTFIAYVVDSVTSATD